MSNILKKNTAEFDHSIIIRKLTETDLPRLLDLYRQLHPKDDPLPSLDQLFLLWKDIIHNPILHYFGVEVNSQIISTCTISIIPNLTRGARPYGLIENVITQIEFRKQGFGTFLLKKVLDFAWKANCYKVMLLTGKKDQETLQFYAHAGFKSGIKTGFIASPP